MAMMPRPWLAVAHLVHCRNLLCCHGSRHARSRGACGSVCPIAARRGGRGHHRCQHKRACWQHPGPRHTAGGEGCGRNSRFLKAPLAPDARDKQRVRRRVTLGRRWHDDAREERRDHLGRWRCEAGDARLRGRRRRRRRERGRLGRMRRDSRSKDGGRWLCTLVLRRGILGLFWPRRNGAGICTFASRREMYRLHGLLRPRMHRNRK